MNRQQRRTGFNLPNSGAASGSGKSQQERSEELAEQFKQRMLDQMTNPSQQATDPDLLSVLREIRDNTGRIARALEESR